MISSHTTPVLIQPTAFGHTPVQHHRANHVAFSGRSDNDDYTPRHNKQTLASSIRNADKNSWFRASVIVLPLIAIGSLLVVRDDIQDDTQRAEERTEQLINDNGALQPELVTLQDNVAVLNAMIEEIRQLQIDTTAVEDTNDALQVDQSEKEIALNEWVNRIDDAEGAIQDLEETLGLAPLTVDDYILMEDASRDQLRYRLERIVSTLTRYSETNETLGQELQALVDGLGLGL